MAIKDAKPAGTAHFQKADPTRLQGDFPPGSHCPGIELELRCVHGEGVTPRVPWVPSSGPLCPSFRIRHPLAAKANWWPGQAAPATTPCLGCHLGNCSRPGPPFFLPRKSCFLFPLSCVGHLEGGEEPPQNKGQEGRAREVARWGRVLPTGWFIPAGPGHLQGYSSPTASLLGTLLPLPRGDEELLSCWVTIGPISQLGAANLSDTGGGKREGTGSM